jgi:hypothetical protein
MYLLYIFPPWVPHTYDFVFLTSLTHPRKILLFVLRIGKQEIRKAKDLSAPLRRWLSWVLECSVSTSNENEILHFSDSPCCVALPPHTSTGVPDLQVWDFIMCFVLSHNWTAVFSLTSNSVSRKLVLMDIVHSTTQVTKCVLETQFRNETVICTHCVIVFCIILSINSDYFTKQQ